MGMRTPALLALGLMRLVATTFMAMVLVILVLVNHGETLDLIWTRPEGGWLLLLWVPLAYLLTALLIGLASVLAYLLSQILFAVFIMDQMSKMTEKKITGHIVYTADNVSFFRQLGFLVKQEIPRAVLPVLCVLILMVLSWLTPLGPVLTVASPWIAVLFLAWDNTDLIPARRLEPFATRFRALMASLPFHLGFGLPFLIPVANILFLSFAPVGAALYHLDKTGNGAESAGKRD
jgi:CysZ protein